MCLIKNLSIHSSIVFGSCLFYSLIAQADSWTITQTVITHSKTTLTQKETRNGSLQGINVINLDRAKGVVVKAEQSLTTGGNDLMLSQDGTDSSIQAVNFISAAYITEAIQTVNNVDAIRLEQKNAGSNNLQALNIAIATGSGKHIDALTQTVTANSVTFEGSGSGNIQAGNYIAADSGNVSQDFNAGDVIYSQTGVNNLQAGNVVIHHATSFGGSVKQDFSAGTVSADFAGNEGNTGSVKAANYMAQQ